MVVIMSKHYPMAFPAIHGTQLPEGGYAQNQILAGMNLRDYFAAKALQGMLAMPNGDGEKEDYARWAYQYADAMLERRGDA
jgi:hypothetical protein